MPSGFRNAAGVDFDDLFDPWVEGSKALPSMRTADGLSIGERYAAVSYGTKGPDVGYRTAAGNDVSIFWAAKNTAVYSIAGLQGKFIQAAHQALTSESQVAANVFVAISQAGGWSVGGGTLSGGSVALPPPTSGTWLPAGTVVTDWQVQFVPNVQTNTGQAVVSNGASAYAAISTGKSFNVQIPTASGANAIEREWEGTVTVNLKHVPTGRIIATSLSMRAYTAGFA